jgi:hypothetical protein
MQTKKLEKKRERKTRLHVNKINKQIRREKRRHEQAKHKQKFVKRTKKKEG